MPSTIAIVFTVLASILALVAIGIYFFGIPPEIKRKMEEKALETMGENKASYIVKGRMSSILHAVYDALGQLHLQIKSRSFPPPTKKTSSSSKRASETLSAAH